MHIRLYVFKIPSTFDAFPPFWLFLSLALFVLCLPFNCRDPQDIGPEFLPW